ncbi:hypothetical protein J7E97_14875 [Streptomyces sp. ISL-66]|uniref:hypothetical protein n=1 Tax=Streptomyces sp. ISL-66 TaxID=2819186 RepID=UPI001BE6CF27|nr:hypothetical protein [Streptomyces sp. ISL-66]MBT2469119.1 hypothetical protein [Streptomyces sp. ISL-66]
MSAPRPSRPAAGLLSRLAVWLLSVVVCLSAAGCAGSSRTEADYRLKAANTAEAAASAVGTARLAVEAAGRGKATGPYLSVLLGEAEKDLAGAEQAFTSRQPPGEAADKVRDQVEEALSDAGDALARARIAARRGQVTESGTQVAELTKVKERLDRLGEQLS